MTEAPYGVQHQRERERLLPKAYGTLCPVCSRVMLRGMDLHLDHDPPLAIDPHSKGRRIIHAACNLAAGGQLGAQRSQLRPSRSW